MRQKNKIDNAYTIVASLKNITLVNLHKEWLVMPMRGGKENRHSGALNIFAITELLPS